MITHAPRRDSSQRLEILVDDKFNPEKVRRHAVLLTIVWATGTLILFLFRAGYTFSPYGYLDSWIYAAYQWDLKHQIAEFGPTYYGSRLSWILPGAAFHSLLPLVAANIAYKLTISAIFSAAGAVIVYRAFGFGAALLAVVLAVLCPQVIEALHTDYIDTAVFVYATLALACITLSKDSARWPWLIFLGGCFFTGMTIANLSALASVGAGVAIYHLVWLRWGFRRQIVCIGLYAAAAAFVFSAIGLIHRMVGGQFLFLKPQIDMLTYMRGLKVNPWIPKDPLWYTEAPWLLLSVSALLWGLYSSLIAPPSDDRKRILIRSLTAGLVTSFSIALLLQAKALNATLSFSFYASFHLCLALPLLVSCLASASFTKPKSAYWLLATIGLLPVVVIGWNPAPVTTALFSYFPFLHSSGATPLFVTVLLLVTSTAAAIAIRRMPRSSLISLLRPELLLLGIFIWSMPIGFQRPAISDRLRERYVSVHNAYRTLARELPAGSYRYWVHPEEDDGVSLASTKLWGYRLFTLKRFPEFEPNDLLAISDKQTLVVPGPSGRGEEILIIANRVLAAAKYTLGTPRIIKAPGEAGIGFDLVCFSIYQNPVDPETSADEMRSADVFMDLNFDSAPPYTLALGQNLYGPRKGNVIDTSQGFPVFTRTDSQDHLATDFKPLRKIKAGETRQLSVVVTMPADGNCVGVIQIEGCQTVAQVTWSKKGRSVHTITIPADSTSLRLYLQSSVSQGTPLPTRITLYELKQ